MFERVSYQPTVDFFFYLFSKSDLSWMYFKFSKVTLRDLIEIFFYKSNQKQETLYHPLKPFQIIFFKTKLIINLYFFLKILLLLRITVIMDDDLVKYYCNEDTFLLEVHQVDEHTHDITLVEYVANWNHLEKKQIENYL